MGRQWMSKAQAVTLITSSLLQEFIDRCRRTDTIRNYYDIAIVGYGNDKIEMLLGEKGWVSIDKIATYRTSSFKMICELAEEDGSYYTVEHNIPLWFEPKAEGNTPLYEALVTIKNLVSEWCGDVMHKECFPPIVINITDGECSDCLPNDLQALASTIRSEGTLDGNVLLMNIHLSNMDGTRSLVFPTDEELEGVSTLTRIMADMSSTMPEIFNSAIEGLKGRLHTPPFKAMGYNANIVELLSILNIGSRSGPTLQ